MKEQRVYLSLQRDGQVLLQLAVSPLICKQLVHLHVILFPVNHIDHPALVHR